VLNRSLVLWFAAPITMQLLMAQKSSIAVVTVIGVAAYTQTAQALREQIPGLQLLDVRDEAGLRERLKDLALVVAVGSDAAATVDRLAPPRLPVVRTDLLLYDAEHGARLRGPGATVTVDIQPAVLLAEVKRLFPGKVRLGVIRGPLQTDGYMRAVEQAARQQGFTLEVLDCPEARGLISGFLRLKNHADLVWCPPDPQLYNSATLKPLLMASLTNRLPIIGFSEPFAEAGALFAGAADFHEVGYLTAELALRILQGETVAARHEARKFLFVYNQRVARLLGVKASGADQPGEQLRVIP